MRSGVGWHSEAAFTSGLSLPAAVAQFCVRRDDKDLRGDEPSSYGQHMTAQEFRSVFEALPFRPFTIHLADGREVAIRHQDYALLSPTGRTLIVYQDDDSFQVLDLMLATGVQVNGKRLKKAHKKKP